MWEEHGQEDSFPPRTTPEGHLRRAYHLKWKREEKEWDREAEQNGEKKKNFKTRWQQRTLPVSYVLSRQTLSLQLTPGLMSQSRSLVWPSNTPNLKSVWLEEEMKKSVSTKLTEICHWGLFHEISDLFLDLQRRRRVTWQYL